MPKSKKELTDKEYSFINEYIKDFNAKQAAIRAGYSENSAQEIGYQLKNKPHIKIHLDKYFEDMEEEKDNFRKLLLDRYKSIICVDPLDHCDDSHEDVIHVTKESPNRKAIKKMTYTRKILDSGDTIQTESIDYHCPIRAGAEIAKLLGLNETPEDNLDKEFNINVHIVRDREDVKKEEK